jgi:hypothetical protein
VNRVIGRTARPPGGRVKMGGILVPEQGFRRDPQQALERREGAQFGGGSASLGAAEVGAVAQEQKAGAQAEGRVQALRANHGRGDQAAPDEARDEFVDLECLVRAEIGRRFVAQQHAFVPGQRTGEGHTLLVAGAQLVREKVLAGRHADQREQIGQFLPDHRQRQRIAPPAHAASPARQPQRQCQVLEDGQRAQQRRFLKDDPHGPLPDAPQPGRPAEVVRAEADYARLDRIDAAEQVDQEALAAAVSPEHHEDLAGPQLEIQRRPGLDAQAQAADAQLRARCGPDRPVCGCFNHVLRPRTKG